MDSTSASTQSYWFLVKLKTNPVKQLNKTQLSIQKKLTQSLSVRELDVAKMILAGKNNKTIAETLHISERTVKAHLTSIFKKTEYSRPITLSCFH